MGRGAGDAITEGPLVRRGAAAQVGAGDAVTERPVLPVCYVSGGRCRSTLIADKPIS